MAQRTYAYEAESLFIDTALFRVLGIEARDRLQAEHFLACSGSEGDTIGAGSRLQGRHGGRRIGFGQVDPSPALQ
jgi:hypothetical protein